MSRHDLTDDQWAVIEPLIPKKQSTRGRPHTDNRRTLNGILSVLYTGCSWADLLKECGLPSTCLATMARVVAGRDLGAHLASPREPPRCRRHAGVGAGVAQQ
ncbi:transposase [Chloroflexus sp.]|uniref:transposase n=1 Tax=Chloroflexus sp. TaxID=1904827 RepID=UPI003A100FAE